MSLMAENSRSNGGLHDYHRASRKAEEAALRRYQAVHWLEHLVGPIGIPSQPSEREFISCLRNGLILCNVINKIQPGSVPKVVEKHVPVQSESVIWDSQPLPAYQYFENVRNFLVAVRDLKLPAFEASDLEREIFEAGSAGRVADCILALKSYHEWKEWSGGKGVYKHVTAKSPLVLHSAAKNFSRPLGNVTARPCRRLDMSGVNETQLLTDSIVKALSGHMVDSKENISGNFLASLQNGNEDPVHIFTELLSRCLEEKLINKFPELKPHYKDTSSKANGTHSQPSSILKENISIQNNSQCHKAQSIKGSSDHWQRLQSQAKDLSDIKVLWSQAKREFNNLQSQLFNDLKNLGSLVDEMSGPALGYQKVVQENRKLYNMVQDLKGNIRVHCRIRPILNAHAKNVIDFAGEDGSLVVVDPTKPRNEGRKVYQFNQVYGPKTTQDELFKDAQPLIRSVMDGYNVCILAYGQTGSGKTHTMYGPSDASTTDIGVNFLALNDLFQMANSRRDVIKYEVYVQMVEICNEATRDLLAEDSASRGESGLLDITIHSVKSNTDAINLLKRGEVNHNVSSTAKDGGSAHSHSVVTVHVHGKDTSGNIFRGCLHLVDLAGSRQDHNSEDSRDKHMESQLPDKSLSCLEDVITSLSQKRSYIPYRNSKLTSLLQDALGGHAKILMLAHVNPEEDCLAETVSTLKFAQKVSTVELGAAHSNKMNSEVMELKQEIEILKSALGEDTPSRSNTQLRSPCEKARVVSDRTPPRMRRLSMENSGSMKTERLAKSPLEKPKITAESTPQKSLRKSIENCSTRNIDKVRHTGAGKYREARSPGPVPRSRRLSIENPIITKSEKAQKLKDPKSPCEGKKGLIKRTPPSSRRLSIENPSTMKSNADSRKGFKTPPPCVKPETGQALSLEDPKSPEDRTKEQLQSVVDIVSSDEFISMMEAPKSPITTGYRSQPTFTDCAAKFPSLQPPKTPEHQKSYRHEMLQTSTHSGVNISADSRTPGTAKSVNGKGSHIRKSLRTIGKLINGSEKRNQQKTDLSTKGKVAANEAKSPPTSKAKRRQSLTGLPSSGSDRRSSLGGMSSGNRPKISRNAKSPPPVVRSSMTKRWM